MHAAAGAPRMASCRRRSLIWSAISLPQSTVSTHAYRTTKYSPSSMNSGTDCTICCRASMKLPSQASTASNGMRSNCPRNLWKIFSWEEEGFCRLRGHFVTEEPLPRALLKKMRAAKNFHSGLNMLRQIVFSIFDLHLHSDFDTGGAITVNELARTLHARYHVIPPVEFSRWPNTFSHIFGGGYAAGYYSYKWAEVLCADAYAAFEEGAEKKRSSVLDARTGQRFRGEILDTAGSRPGIASFKAFRGRAPTIDALLRQHGMSAASSIHAD